MRNASVAWGLLGMVLACPGVAQQNTPAPGLYRFSIPAEPLGDALSELAQQTGLQVMIASKLADGVHSRELKGTYSADQALQQLLANTGLQFTFVNPHTVAINTTTSAAPRAGQTSAETQGFSNASSSSADATTNSSDTKDNSTDGGKKMQIQNRGFLARMLGLFAICGSATHTGTACAQQAGSATDSVALEEVIVTAQRREERLKDVPLTVVALSSDQLEKSGVTNIFDLQNVVSGLTYSGVGNSTQPAIRGLSTMVSTNGSENPNALYIDGVYYATNQLLGANLPDVARVEVLKGPQGTLFGRNSVGGAIRIFTRNPTFTPTGDFTVDAGYYTGNGTSRSNPHGAFRGFVSVPLVDDTLAVSLSGGYDATEGFMTNDATGDKYGKIVRTNARTKLLWQANDSIKAVFDAYYLKHNDEGLQSATPLNGHVAAAAFPDSIVPVLPYHTAYDSGLGVDVNVATVKNHGFGANVQFDLADFGTLTSITDWNTNEVVNLTTFSHSKAPTCMATPVVVGGVTVSYRCVDYSYFFKLKALSQELNFSSEKFGMFRTTAGLFYYHQSSTTDAFLQATVIPGGKFLKSENFKIDSSAAYGELEIQPIDSLTFIVGGRYTHEVHDDVSTGIPSKQVTFNSFIPRLTTKYAFTPQLNVYATYSVGEKAGLSGIANTASTPKYASVDPEKNNAYEIGMKYASTGFTFNLSGFYYDYKNKQEQGFTGTSVFLLNSGPVRIEGLDADTSIRFNREFTVRANASWVPTAEYRDFPNAVGYALTPAGTATQLKQSATGLRLVKAPELTANASLDYVHDMSKGVLDASMNVSYSSTVYHDIFHVMQQSPYTTLNAQTGYTFGDKGPRVSLYGRNITNKAYIANGFSSGQGFTVAYARPREIGLSVNYSY
jgi:iron complex outermembrane recepter protein